ncbi:hypothetical protein DMC30DRAFT_394429 [Rhodotorula diobovata]|uniref:Chromatin modification-related protein n=1 Tax=Rhodotorula diobovata TaxID=5288 RepID=A0A5C5FYH2_9BASI|nr:hypothetical protein DMC30DRAFT_394429 [Rhodotorula diobovata]
MATEDAAVLLADFVSSLDNLPSEVCHILEEISHKEGRVSDLRSRALQRDQAIQKHARPVAQGGQGLLVPNPKEESSVKKIKLDLENAEITTKEKVALSERGVNLLSRHLNRLQAQLELLTSSVPPLPTLPSFAPTTAAATPTAMYNAQPNYAATPGGSGYNAYTPYGTPGTPGYADKRKASAGQVPLLPAQLTPGSNGLPNSYPFPGAPGTPGTPIGANAARRGGGVGPSRLANVAYASPAPGTPQSVAPAPGGHHGQHHGQQGQQPNLAFLQQQQQMQQAQLRLAQQQAQHLAQQQLASQAQMAQLQAAQAHGGGGAGGMSHQMAQHGAALAAHLAASGNKRKRGDEDSRKATEEVEGEVEGEDLTPYCFCQRPSFGEMIGCDAPDCKIEWFHLNCIGLKESPEGSWYCSQCEPRMKAQGRGGRKR